jgi:hypothetical protein
MGYYQPLYEHYHYQRWKGRIVRVRWYNFPKPPPKYIELPPFKRPQRSVEHRVEKMYSNPNAPSSSKQVTAGATSPGKGILSRSRRGTKSSEEPAHRTHRDGPTPTVRFNSSPLVKTFSVHRQSLTEYFAGFPLSGRWSVAVEIEVTSVDRNESTRRNSPQPNSEPSQNVNSLEAWGKDWSTGPPLSKTEFNENKADSDINEGGYFQNSTMTGKSNPEVLIPANQSNEGGYFQNSTMTGKSNPEVLIPANQSNDLQLQKEQSKNSARTARANRRRRRSKALSLTASQKEIAQNRAYKRAAINEREASDESCLLMCGGGTP